eukprot:CAMPEP_0176017608 /NCGR_PEP_ID=MMETSP0120_2-20121206/8450_1 /TAXON_ID=160619 /ORGANISM="Kryptoperidinium foliaceum, Strain CCMP 1326" /LENGTH=512 /DNA_ID=CAMNT_0017350633 /DNA_START=18 /DNA_END=1556 /DNA_ORIENTATION=-
MPGTGELVRHVVFQAVPNALSQLALVTVSFVTILFVSQLRDSEILGGVGVGTMFYNIFGLSLGIGMTAGLDTLVSQSNGAGLYERSGIHLQGAVVVCTLVAVPASVILFFTEDILVAIGQDVGVAERAGEYVRGALFSLWPMYISSSLSAFLRAQTLPQASVYATWGSNVFHVFSCWLFISYLDLGAFGAGLAFSATQIFSMAILLSYIHFVRPGVTQKSWISWDQKRAVSDLRGFMEKALPCAMLMWAEWWCAEVMTLLAGYLGVAALAAHTAVMQMFVLIYMTSGGIACAGAALVGNAVGAGAAALARRSAVVAALVMLVACAAMDLALVVCSQAIMSLFTQDESVQRSMAALLDILLVVVPLDSLQTVIDGILRGLGKQAQAFKVKIWCMWAVRVPLAFYLGFHTTLGVRGIWWGSLAGLAMTMALYLVLLFRIDWEQEVLACKARQVAHSPAASGGASATLLSKENRASSFDAQMLYSPVPGMCRCTSNVEDIVMVGGETKDLDTWNI